MMASVSILHIITIFSVLLPTVAKDHGVPTFFARLHEDGTLIDRSLPEYNAEIESKPWINRISRDDAKSIKLQAWPDTVKNGEKVTVLWSGVDKPTTSDFVAYYCPYYDDVNHYVDYFWTRNSVGWKKGYAHVELTVYNMREPCIFKFYRASKNNTVYVLAATSNKLYFADGGPNAPLQGHIAMTNKPSEMRIMWTSGQLTQPPFVRYGTTKNLAQKESAHLTHTYTKDSMCQPPANGKGFYHPGMIYDILLTNLKPNTLYYYLYGTADYMSAIANFTTPIPKGDATPYKFVIYGDMGVDPFPQADTTAKLVRRDLDENKIRFVFHHGDISYARGYAYIWEQWSYMVEPYATLVPYMVGVGNHEQDHVTGGEHDPSKAEGDGGFRPPWWNSANDSGGECGVPTFHRFHMPDNGNAVFWYSFDYGLVHMVMMSTEHDFTPGSPQYKWLENDLKKVDRKETPWVLVGGHRAMYNTEDVYTDYKISLHMREEFESLLYKYKVDIAFWAHYHSYERTCKLYNSTCIDDGVLHITVGSAGKGRDVDRWYPRHWSLVRIADYGYGRLTVANSSALLYEFVQNKHNKVTDHVWLRK